MVENEANNKKTFLRRRECTGVMLVSISYCHIVLLDSRDKPENDEEEKE